ncbi:MAG: septal ring lytic transglycosylase RlpA family protein, partial [Desulfovibrionaceae bacterium]|nr:septal ring lytic transglycosylase RlpA family protein [Desulfovibrionaceae bacterium]
KLEVVTDSKGTPLKARQAFFVQYQAAKGNLKAGPYKSFSDASAMHEALRQAHPDAKVILDDLR